MIKKIFGNVISSQNEKGLILHANLATMIVNIMIFSLILVISGKITKLISKRDNLNEFLNRIDLVKNNEYQKIPIKKYIGANGYIEILDEDLNVIYPDTGEHSKKYSRAVFNFISDVDRNTSYSIMEQFLKNGRTEYIISEYSYDEGEYREYDFESTVLTGMTVLDEDYNIIYSNMSLSQAEALNSNDIDALFENNDRTFSVKHLIPSENGKIRYLIAHLDAGSKPVDRFINRLIFVSIILAIAISIILNFVFSGMAAAKINEKIHARNYHTAGYIHDINNSLTSIMGYVGELSRGGNTEEEKENFLNIVLQKAEDASELSKCFYDFYRFNSPDFKLNAVPCDLVAIYKRFIAKSFREFRTHGFFPEIRISLTSAHALIDEIQIERVFNNLKNNFIKYCNSGTVVYFGIHTVKDTLVVEIGNNGSPIDEAIRKKIFTPYIKGKNSLSGSGLGLALSAKIVSLHSGKIELTKDNSRNITTLFRIELPLISYEN